MNVGELVASFNAKTLVFTVTAGRSGTKLLATLLRESLGLYAEHEPAPRVNFVLRSFICAPEAARNWLVTEKLPAILERSEGPVYVETSHLFCKGLIEPMLKLGLRPRFIILTRPASDIAQSLLQLDVIPERTSAGRLVLLGPGDPGVLPLPDWQSLSDYQLCYWYAREIERRQFAYEKLFGVHGLEAFWVKMSELTDWVSFQSLARFVTGNPDVTPDQAAFERIATRNQHPRTMLQGNASDRSLPPDTALQERAVDDLLSASS